MKVLKVNGKDYIVKFTSKTIQELNSQGVTLIQLTNDLQEMKVDNLYKAFHGALKSMQHDITLDKALSIIDEYYEENEDNDIESFFGIVIEEYSSAMGLGKKFKEMMKQSKVEVE